MTEEYPSDDDMKMDNNDNSDENDDDNERMNDVNNTPAKVEPKYTVEDNLANEDSVLDDNLMTWLKQYAYERSKEQDKTTKQDLMKFLGEGQQMAINNYKGYTRMCSLLIDWMKHFKEPKMVHNIFINALKESAKIVCKDMSSVNVNDIINKHTNQSIISGGSKIMTKGSKKGYNIENFHKTFNKLLSKVIKSETQDGYKKEFIKFVEYITRNEIFYVYSKNIISKFREMNQGSLIDYSLAKLEGEIDAYCLNNNINEKIKELSVFSVLGTLKSDLKSVYLQLFKENSMTNSDLTKIFNMYTNNDNNTPYPLKYLQTKIMMDCLYTCIFVPKAVRINREYIQKYIHLLSFNILSSMNINKMDKNELKKIDEMLFDISELCRNKSYQLILLDDKKIQDTIIKGCNEYAGIAYGIIKWMNHCIINESSSYFQETQQVYITNLFLHILSNILLKHKQLHIFVTQLCIKIIFHSKSGLDPDNESKLLEKLFDLLVLIIQLGSYNIVFNGINNNDLSTLDRALLRYFVNRIVSKYTGNDKHKKLPKQFMQEFLSTLKNPNILISLKNSNTKIKLLKFINSFVPSCLPNFTNDLKKMLE